ncbi:MAG: menaquinone-dependent protoporphyrinogen IX dehydrogenase [Plesiomonas sp.]
MADTLLLLYSSTDGQTQRIMENIAATLSPASVELRDIQQPFTPQWDNYRAVLIGASIRYGHFNPAVEQFIGQHQQTLNTRPSAFFGVNLTARKEGKNTPQTNAYIKKFLQRSPWKPKLAAVFAGALYYPRYKWFDRIMIQLIMRITGGETDTSKEIEYTNWDKVKEFAQQFSELARLK